VYANPKGDKHERFQVTHQGPDKGGPHGMPAMKVSYHPDALSAQAHAEKLAGKGAERVREETELDEVRQTASGIGSMVFYKPGGTNKPNKLTPEQLARKKKEAEHLAAIKASGGKGFKEETELDELDRPSKGKDTILSRYASRNLQQSRQNAGQSFPGAIDATASTGKKISRGIGLATAANKITGHAKVPAVAREETELDELSSTYEKPGKAPQRMLKPAASERLAKIADRRGMSKDDVLNVLHYQGAGRKSLKAVTGMRKEETE
jgi:hypothetical protein